jgi:hypothetical protein
VSLCQDPQVRLSGECSGTAAALASCCSAEEATSYLREVIPDAIVPGFLGGHNFRINDRLGILPATKSRAIQMSQRLSHECSEESAKLVMSVQWQNVGNMLIGSHDDECSLLAVDAAQVEDIVAVPEVGTI